MEPYYDAGGVTVYHADAPDLLRSLPEDSVQLIATDPPYFRVKDEDWDNAWDSEAAFLLWMRRLCKEWRRVLAPNGSLYVFASPQMAHGVEAVVRRYFRVLNHVVWRKELDRGKHAASDKDILRGFFPNTERVLFAEQYGSDEHADDASGYTAACEALKRRIFGDYMRAEFERAGVTNKQVAALFPSRTGGLTGCVSNWLLGFNVPTPEQYQEMRRLLNDRGGDYLQLKYEGLREKYEGLRRPFNATPDAPYTDVWDFPTVSSYAGKHPTQKPLAMMEHIVRLSSRPGDTVLDTFSGSGTTAEAARNLGRKAIVADNDSHWVRQTALRLSQGVLPLGGP